MLTDATGQFLQVGDRIGTISGGQNRAVVTGEIIRMGAVMVTVKVEESTFVGEPESGYARKPTVGEEHRFHARLVFRLGPCEHEQRKSCREFSAGELRTEVFRTSAPGKHLVHVRITHIPTGCSHHEEDYSELEAKARAIQVLERIVAIHEGRMV